MDPAPPNDYSMFPGLPTETTSLTKPPSHRYPSTEVMICHPVGKLTRNDTISNQRETIKEGKASHPMITALSP